MYVFPPVLMQMVRDRRVTPTDLRVWVVASQRLDFEEFRPLKILPLAYEMHLDRSHVARSIRNLSQLGYLDRRRAQMMAARDARCYVFRLPFSQRVAKSATSQNALG